LGEKRGSFPLKGSNWFTLPLQATAAAWKEHLQLLDDMHRSMREAIATLPASRLNDRTPNSKNTNLAVISGIAYHDVYHAGQIQLLKRLMQRR